MQYNFIFMPFLIQILFYMIVGMVIHVLWLIDYLKACRQEAYFPGKNKLNNKNHKKNNK